MPAGDTCLVCSATLLLCSTTVRRMGILALGDQLIPGPLHKGGIRYYSASLWWLVCRLLVSSVEWATMWRTCICFPSLLSRWHCGCKWQKIPGIEFHKLFLQSIPPFAVHFQVMLSLTFGSRVVWFIACHNTMNSSSCTSLLIREAVEANSHWLAPFVQCNFFYAPIGTSFVQNLFEPDHSVIWRSRTFSSISYCLFLCTRQ